MMPVPTKRLVVAAAVFYAAACSDHTAGPTGAVDAPAVAVVTLSPRSLGLRPGETVRLAALVQDTSGQELSGLRLEWASSDPTVVTVDRDGRVRAVGIGSATITVRAGPKSHDALIVVSANQAQFVSQSVPTALQPGEQRTVSITMRNTGTSTWTPDEEYKLGSQNPQDNDTWGTGRIYLEPGETVEPGQSKTFFLDLTAPATPGTYDFQWRMVQDGVEWFGAFSPNLSITVQPPAQANDARFEGQVVPTSLLPGETRRVSITMRNAGSTTWTRGGEYKLGSQNPQDNDRWGTGRIYLAPGEAVAPGQTKTFTFDVSAPTTPGTYDFQWRMVQDGVEWFGDRTTNVQIVVQPPTRSNDATVEGVGVPSVLQPGETRRASVTMRNTGTSTWTRAGEYKLGSQSPQDNTRWGTNRIYLEPGNVIAPGQAKTFDFDITAPTTPGVYDFQWRMVQDGVEWFGGLTTNIPITVQAPAQRNDAQFVAQDVPTTLRPGERRQVSVTMRNSGTSTWTRAGEYKLGSQNPQDNGRWGTGRVYLEPDDAVAPGQSKTFTFEIVAPAAPDTYDFQWRMVQDNVEWFGALTTNVRITVQPSSHGNDAQFVSQDVPTQLAPGERRRVSITMKNSGTLTWTRAGLYRLGSQNPQDNSTWGISRVELGAEAVAPGQSVTFGFEIVAPASPRTYDFQWRMLQENVEWFGAFTDNVAIAVGGAGGGGNCPAADPTDKLPDDGALQACLDGGGTVKLVPGQPGYLIAAGLKITQDGTVLTSAEAPAKATILAHPNLFAPVIEAQNRANFTIEHLVVDGNKANRTRLGDCQGYRPFGVNIIIGVSRGFTVRNTELRNAMCGTALGLNGSSFEIAHNVVADNGFAREQQPRVPEPWADGITAGICDHGWIHHNTLTNNTDVDLLSGGGRGCRVEDNTITQNGVHAFAGLAVHNFEFEGKGDHTDAVFQRNSITSSLNGLDFGISVGIHPWFPKDETQYGLITDNTASGAVVNLAVDGYAFGTVRNNTLRNPQGSFSPLVNCPNFRANYTAGHVRSADLQPGWVSKYFDQGVVCGSDLWARRSPAGSRAATASSVP